jgi:alkylation response protein AidB-like acyl-CoA dehydrogenase
VKSRISNACTADVAVVLARDGDPTGPKLCYVIVDLRRARITRIEQPKLGLSAMSWGSIQFDGVAIPAEDVIVDADMDTTLRAVEWGQLLQAWCAIGIAASALSATLDHARTRQAFGRPIGHLEVVRGRIADMHVELDAARLLTFDATVRKAAGAPSREQVVMAKIYATEMAVRIADQAMRTFGGWGYSKDHIVERLYRDSLANVPAGLPTDRLRELLACGMVGADAWRYEPFDGLASAGLRLGG